MLAIGALGFRCFSRVAGAHVDPSCARISSPGTGQVSIRMCGFQKERISVPLHDWHRFHHAAGLMSADSRELLSRTVGGSVLVSRRGNEHESCLAETRPTPVTSHPTLVTENDIRVADTTRQTPPSTTAPLPPNGNDMLPTDGSAAESFPVIPQCGSTKVLGEITERTPRHPSSYRHGGTDCLRSCQASVA